jgi:hypothetical protein
VYAVRIAADGSLVKGARRVGRPGDHFGAAVAVDPRSHATIVGAPGAAQNAGAVVLYPDDKLTLHSGRRHVQATPHAGDRFGASVVIGAALAGCQEATQWAAGAPGDDVGGLRNAGSLTIATLGSLAAQTCPALLLRAGRGLPGPAITNARLGAGVTLVRYRDDFDEDTYDAYAVAVPGRHEVVRHGQRFQLGAPGKIKLAIPESGDSF